MPAASEPPKSGAAEPEVNENSTATKVPAASCECIFNSLTSSVREEMKCVSVCQLFFDLFRTEGTEKERRKGKLDMLLIGAFANVLTCRVRVAWFVLRASCFVIRDSFFRVSCFAFRVSCNFRLRSRHYKPFGLWIKRSFLI